MTAGRPSQISMKAWQVMTSLKQADLDERAKHGRKPGGLRCTSEAVGYFLYMNVLVKRPKRILELGTSVGYSTLWLAAAAKQVGAIVETVEADDEKIRKATENRQALALHDLVVQHHGDATDVLTRMSSSYDFVFIDIGGDHIALFEALRPRIAAGGVVFVDGAGRSETWEHESESMRLFRYLQDAPDFEVSIVDLGDKSHLWATNIPQTVSVSP